MCLNSFGKEDLLDQHIEYCQSNKSVRVEFSRDDYLFFRDHERKVMVTFVVYVDFECFTVPIVKPLMRLNTNATRHRVSACM